MLVHEDEEEEDEVGPVTEENASAEPCGFTENADPLHEMVAEAKGSISIEVDGKFIHKRTLVKNAFAAKPRSTDRLKRVQYVPRFAGDAGDAPDDFSSVGLGGNEDAMFCLSDPFCCLVNTYSESHQQNVICLAVATVEHIQTNNASSVFSIDCSHLNDASTILKARVLQLHRQDRDWYWNSSSDATKLKFQIPANHIKVLDPAVGVLNNKPAMRVRDSYLKGLRGEWDALLGDDTASVTTEMLKGIPRVQSPLLPYQYQHEEYFICPTASYWLAQQAEGGIVDCTFCREKRPLPLMRQHIGYHLVTGKGAVDEQTCGFCGLTGTCTTVLKMGTKSAHLRPSSNCKMYYKFSTAAASKLNHRNLCTNVPVLCPHCPSELGIYIWKYSLPSHYEAKHPSVSIPPNLIVSISEKSTLQSKKP